MDSRFVPSVLLTALMASLALATASPAQANERRFTYTYESALLNPGDREIEPWSTFRMGRADFYNRLDNRLEFEMGVVKGLQTALYFNWSSVTKDVNGAREHESAFTGVSSEWKLKLSDPVANAFGSALYLEITGGPEEAEVEGKLILDKRTPNFLFAFNATGEHGWEFENKGQTVREGIVELNAGAAWLATSHLSAGIEARNFNLLTPDDGWSFSALFAGPSVGYATKTWWTTLTVLPQLYKLKGGAADRGRRLVLSDLDRVEARLLFGFHL